MDISKERINALYRESIEKGYSKEMQELLIELGANTRSVYDVITMGANQVFDLLMNEIQKRNPDLELIQDILAYSVVDINGKNSNGYTALMFAANWGNEKCVELLLNHPKIDVNVKDQYNGETAWSLATDSIRQKFPKLNPNS